MSLGGSAIAAGDVGDKHLVMSTQTQRWSLGQSSGQQAGQMAGRRDGWVDESNPHSSRVVGGSFGRRVVLGHKGQTKFRARFITQRETHSL